MGIERFLERIAAFFRLPYWPYDPAAEIAREGVGTWRPASVAAWTMMGAALLATWSVTTYPVLLIELTVLLAAAFPVNYALHYRTTSRLLVNWVVFSLSAVLGVIQLGPLWPLRHGWFVADNVESMSFLILCFAWIMVFRAYALRTSTELVQTILPCGSIILLVLLLRPEALTLGCMALVVAGALALLAAEARINSRQGFHPVHQIERTHVARRRTGLFYSWGTIYILVLLVAVGVAYAAAQSELSGGLGERLRIAMAQRVLAIFQFHENFALPDTAVNLARLTAWPNTALTVFTVRSKQPGNWRTLTYHTYTGAFWQRGVLHQDKAHQQGQTWQIPLTGSGVAARPGTRVEQTFVAKKSLLGSLPALFCPVELQLDTEGVAAAMARRRNKLVRYASDRALTIPVGVPPGTVYHVVSYVPPVLPISQPGVEVLPAELARDLQLPDTLPQRVRDLARKITVGATTPYEQARDIEQYLMYGYKYTLQVHTAWPNDFVDTFLFVTQKGFCHHFAGSMVVLCRCLGLPTRLASGYLRGEEDPNDPDLYTVREKDAHVWPEVYFAGKGWTAFDPTPAAPAETNVFADAWKQIVTQTVQGNASVWSWVRMNWPQLVAGLVGLVLLTWWAGWRREQRRWAAFGSQRELARVVRAYVRLRRLLVRRGAPDSPALGPREFLTQLPTPAQSVEEEAAALTEKYLRARFSGRPVDDRQATAAEQLLQAVRRGLRH
jgi:transglutaminase-like putative cysteine protease